MISRQTTSHGDLSSSTAMTTTCLMAFSNYPQVSPNTIIWYCVKFICSPIYLLCNPTGIIFWGKLAIFYNWFDCQHCLFKRKISNVMSWIKNPILLLLWYFSGRTDSQETLLVLKSFAHISICSPICIIVYSSKWNVAISITDSEQSETPIAENKYRDPGHYLAPKINGVKIESDTGAKADVVRGLASALLQVSQAIHHKYIKRPLGKTIFEHPTTTYSQRQKYDRIRAGFHRGA